MDSLNIEAQTALDRLIILLPHDVLATSAVGDGLLFPFWALNHVSNIIKD